MIHTSNGSYHTEQFIAKKYNHRRQLLQKLTPYQEFLSQLTPCLNLPLNKIIIKLAGPALFRGRLRAFG